MIGATTLVVAEGADKPSPSLRSHVVVTHVVDGDTVDVSTGQRVRLIGIDTPEHGAKCFDEANVALARMVEDQRVTLVDPSSVQQRDRYGRILRYVDIEHVDIGYSMIAKGYAAARYDSLDGYDHHPRQTAYRSMDMNVESPCRRREAEARQARADKRAEARAADQRAKAERVRMAKAKKLAKARKLARLEAAAAKRRAAEASRSPDRQGSSSSSSSGAFVPPAGWQTDATMPGYTGCRQGYPGGRINGVYVWKPIKC